MLLLLLDLLLLDLVPFLASDALSHSRGRSCCVHDLLLMRLLRACLERLARLTLDGRVNHGLRRFLFLSDWRRLGYVIIQPCRLFCLALLSDPSDTVSLATTYAFFLGYQAIRRFW